MKNEFKAGDLVFELSFVSGIKLTELTTYDDPTYSIKGSSELYTANGLDIDNDTGVPSLLPANPKNRQALVTLYGEDAVPELPLRGSELTRKLLEKQKYVMCWTSNLSDERAREWPHSACIATATEDDGFTLADGGFAIYAIPIDMNGNEITEIESC